MNYRAISVTLTAAVLLLGGHYSIAADTKAAPAQLSGSNAKVSDKTKLVDINAAKTAELKNLPGVGDAEASKIIAGRPYSSKADLVVRNVVDAAIYENLKTLIVARQPHKDAGKNAALYAK